METGNEEVTRTWAKEQKHTQNIPPGIGMNDDCGCHYWKTRLIVSVHMMSTLNAMKEENVHAL